MNESHPLDWYPEPDDNPKGVASEIVESWVDAVLDYEDSRPAVTRVAVLIPPIQPSAKALERARSQWDQRVYFMQCADCHLIKIGTSKNVRARKAQLERNSDHILDVLGVQLGDRWTEAMVHGTFARDRVRGEWFRASDALLEYIGTHAHPFEVRS